ncbi:hypothetical protein AJ80_05061 [Polytolypa hystricis UAMH7299]|uniref:Uncharacterized protein n=1 Tax=Polytolypa hystricis (strain UAMH7299) TaxID=1447883 RepID=A0A2B7Y8H6_POLH7|nr:hypothetical protein AJ80_05061 [Polytolypa hystricis UAMH7299]
MTQVKGWSLTSDLETFRRGATAYRNAREWAKEKRDEFIRSANEKHLRAKSQHSSISQHPTASDLTTVLDDSDTSTESDEYEDALWSFAAPIEGGEGLQGQPKKPRIRASEFPETVGDVASRTDGDSPTKFSN